jgi:hypothetical protein
VRGFFAGDAFMAIEACGARDFDGTLADWQWWYGRELRGMLDGARAAERGQGVGEAPQRGLEQRHGPHISVAY